VYAKKHVDKHQTDTGALIFVTVTYLLESWYILLPIFSPMSHMFVI